MHGRKEHDQVPLVSVGQGGSQTNIWVDKPCVPDPTPELRMLSVVLMATAALVLAALAVYCPPLCLLLVVIAWSFYCAISTITHTPSGTDDAPGMLPPCPTARPYQRAACDAAITTDPIRTSPKTQAREVFSSSQHREAPC